MTSRRNMAMIMAVILVMMAGPILAADPPAGLAAGQPPAKPGGAAATAAVSTGPQPELFMAETNFDFGTVKPDTEVTHEFLVENKGKGELLIESVTPG